MFQIFGKFLFFEAFQKFGDKTVVKFQYLWKSFSHRCVIEYLLKVMKVRKRCQSAQLQTELIELLKHMFQPSRKLIKEQVIQFLYFFFFFVIHLGFRLLAASFTFLEQN